MVDTSLTKTMSEHSRLFSNNGNPSGEELSPSYRELAEALTFDPADGRIWLNSERIMMIRPETLGSIRNEIIQCVGVERARGILTRSGYIAGMRDARLVASRWPKDNPATNLLAGTRLFGLEGGAKVETLHFEFDPERLTFSGEFLWHNTLEDDEHINQFGVGSDVACWMPIGYANGYVSTLLSTPIVFREVECRATGSAVCRVIGKSEKEWGDADDDFQHLKAENFVGENRGDTPQADLAEQRPPVEDGPHIVGISASFNAACHMLRKVAPTRATVLFIGESGVGKELFAKMLHFVSPRRSGPFISVNCAAIPDSLAEAELFGVERGAYTGATASRPGRFERSDGGTLFLDEIASLSLASQGKLLRALQEGEVERVGGVTPIKLDLRVVAACNVDLREEVRCGRFREDLFYRLNVYPIALPPLRSRAEDIPLLMTHFLRRYCAEYGREIHGFTQRAVRAMLTYHFPGNVRELQNMVERAVISASDERHIDMVHLFRDEWLDQSTVLGIGEKGRLSDCTTSDGMSEQPQAQLLDRILELRETIETESDNWLDEMQNKLVAEAVTRCNGNMSAAARLLGLTRTQIVYRTRKSETE